MRDTIIIVDFGGQYAHLIASRIRRIGVWTEIISPEAATKETLSASHIKGVILSGGPQSVTADGSPQMPEESLNCGKPILGICYGHQYLCHTLGGTVTAGKKREYGAAQVMTDTACPLFTNIPAQSTFWMSHWDQVSELPAGFTSTGATPECANAAVWDKAKQRFGIQFHPEVTHSEFGAVLLSNFVQITKAEKSWSMKHFLASQAERIKAQVGDRNVFLFVSGGVDSTVCFSLLSQILGGDRVRGVFVDTGLLRKNERDWVERSLIAIGANLTVIDANDVFLKNLEGKTDPEEKRNIIGQSFLQVQKEYFSDHPLGENWVLAQGTIYPDTIETGATKHAAKIKTHHNRIPEIEEMIAKGLVIEPVADLYKDEVRELGLSLGLPEELIWRHPFPGPGLGVRILCSAEPASVEVDLNENWVQLPIQSVGVQGDFRTYASPAMLLESSQELSKYEEKSTELINQNSEINRCLVPLAIRKKTTTISRLEGYISPGRINTLQEADAIVTQALLDQNYYSRIWQFPVVLVPLSFGGGETIVLRPVDSIDAMSASVGKLPLSFLTEVAKNILAILPGIGAVLVDVTTKPPGTIEWE